MQFSPTLSTSLYNGTQTGITHIPLYLPSFFRRLDPGFQQLQTHILYSLMIRVEKDNSKGVCKVGTGLSQIDVVSSLFFLHTRTQSCLSGRYTHIEV